MFDGVSVPSLVGMVLGRFLEGPDKFAAILAQGAH